MQSTRTPPPFILRLPPKKQLSPFIFAAPHSGRHYPPCFKSRARLDDQKLRQSEDAFVDILYENVCQYGGTLLVATHARAYLDLNRASNELDPKMFSPRLDPHGLNISHRVKAGLGLIPKIINDGMPIYKSPLPAREAANRLEQIHIPYHQTLARLLGERRAQFGTAYLIDCHSMPSPAVKRRDKYSGPDIVLGDSWGSSCSREFTALSEQLFIKAGFRVRRNVPYSGGFSTVHYGTPSHNIHALQIEINRALYMDEASHTPLPNFADIQKALLNVSQQLIKHIEQQSKQDPALRHNPLYAAE